MTKPDISKIIRTLDLSKSPAREKTIEGIIEYILHCVNEECTLNDISSLIKLELLFEVHESELKQGIDSLLDSNSILFSEEKLKLSNERKIELDKKDLEARELRQKRFENFCSKLNEICEDESGPEKLDLLWETFTTYLQTCYLEFGKSVIEVFRPSKSKIKDESLFNTSAIFRDCSSNLDEKDKNLLSIYVQEFPQLASSSDLEYLTNLALKSESFFSLGLSEEERKFVDSKMEFDWKIFVDTNFLYSILNLHTHPETPASKAVLDIGKSLGMKFRYLPETLKELEHKKEDFDKLIDKKLVPSQMKALIKSKKLDEFTHAYLKSRLLDAETPHPSDIIIHAQKILKEQGIEIYRNSLEGLKKRETFIIDNESKLTDYHRMIDEVRQDKGLPPKFKDPLLIQHDNWLRLVIKYHRESKPASFSEIKHFGLTLDKTLIRYDKSLNFQENGGFEIPSFFLPSLLLNRLVKYEHVKTDDYRRAFISTISTPALMTNFNTSKVAMRSVRYFHKMGISDETLILDCLRDELFSSKFQDDYQDKDALKEFVQSTIDKKISEMESSKNALEGQLKQAKENEITQVKLKGEKVKELNRISVQISGLNERLALYEDAVAEFRKREALNAQATRDSSQLDILHEELTVQNTSLKEEIKTQAGKNEKLVTEIRKHDFYLRWVIFSVISLAYLSWRYQMYSGGSVLKEITFFTSFAALILIIPIPKHWQYWIGTAIAIVSLGLAI